MDTSGFSKREAIWIPVSTAIWILLWLNITLDINPFTARNYAPAIIAGLAVGFLSGLSPKKAFWACFYGFLILWFFFAFGAIFPYYSIALRVALVIMPLIAAFLCGLFGIAATLLRRIVLHQEIEKIHLEKWQWTLLLGGVVILVDILFLSHVIFELYLYLYGAYEWTYFVPFLVGALLGLFALGLFAGAFQTCEYKGMVLSALQILLIAHGLFLLFLAIQSASPLSSSKTYLSLLFCIISSAIMLSGIHLGHFLNKRKMQ
jgi:hypothetical protein